MISPLLSSVMDAHRHLLLIWVLSWILTPVCYLIIIIACAHQEREIQKGWLKG